MAKQNVKRFEKADHVIIDREKLEREKSKFWLFQTEI